MAGVAKIAGGAGTVVWRDLAFFSADSFDGQISNAFAYVSAFSASRARCTLSSPIPQTKWSRSFCSSDAIFVSATSSVASMPWGNTFFIFALCKSL